MWSWNASAVEQLIQQAARAAPAGTAPRRQARNAACIGRMACHPVSVAIAADLGADDGVDQSVR